MINSCKHFGKHYFDPVSVLRRATQPGVCRLGVC
jgi:hypothetical protein